MVKAKIIVALGVALAAVYLFNTLTTFAILGPVMEQYEANKPAKLELTIISADCERCFDINNVVNALKRENVEIDGEKTVTFSSSEGSGLLKKYAIETVPALIVEGETGKESLDDFFRVIGARKKDGAVLIHDIPPFYSVYAERVRGLVNLILLTDESCSECYDVSEHIGVLGNLGISLDKVETVDVSTSRGKELIEKYKIKNVPTIILDPEVGIYNSLSNVWENVGTVESDEWHVFRATEVMGAYKDLETGDVVGAETSNTAEGGGHASGGAME